MIIATQVSTTWSINALMAHKCTTDGGEGMPRTQKSVDEQLAEAEAAVERYKKRVVELRQRARRERREAMERSSQELARTVVRKVGRPLSADEVDLAAAAAVEALSRQAAEGTPGE